MGGRGYFLVSDFGVGAGVAGLEDSLDLEGVEAAEESLLAPAL